MQIYIVQLLRKRFKANFLKQLVDQAIMPILESFKLTCDVASVFAFATGSIHGWSLLHLIFISDGC